MTSSPLAMVPLEVQPKRKATHRIIQSLNLPADVGEGLDDIARKNFLPTTEIHRRALVEFLQSHPELTEGLEAEVDRFVTWANSATRRTTRRLNRNSCS